jgi:folate-binding protein YgfZ
MMAARKTMVISGNDAATFLQGLVTNDVEKAREDLVYAALLTPQGKLIADFFLGPYQEGFLLDTSEAVFDPLMTRLGMYKLRADVTIAPSDLRVHTGDGTVPEDGFADPRDPALGWRAYRSGAPEHGHSHEDMRVSKGIPEFGRDIGPDTYILEAGFERLNGVDFRKGCYVGQEVTARMKHKTELRKGLVVVGIKGSAPEGTEITREGRPVGTLHSQSGDKAIAYLRFDRAGPGMIAGDATIIWAGTEAS